MAVPYTITIVRVTELGLIQREEEFSQCRLQRLGELTSLWPILAFFVDWLIDAEREQLGSRFGVGPEQGFRAMSRAEHLDLKLGERLSHSGTELPAIRGLTSSGRCLLSTLREFLSFISAFPSSVARALAVSLWHSCWRIPSLDSTCGDWAGVQSVWESQQMSGNCFPKYANCAAANMDPASFSEAYFEVNYIKGESKSWREFASSADLVRKSTVFSVWAVSSSLSLYILYFWVHWECQVYPNWLSLTTRCAGTICSNHREAARLRSFLPSLPPSSRDSPGIYSCILDQTD